jgi:oligopeptidase B
MSISTLCETMTDTHPPVAKRAPKELVLHGDVRLDNYYWLRDRKDPDVLDYVLKENEYTARAMAHTSSLQEKLYSEMGARIPEEDTTVPRKVDDYYYYERTVRGRQYAIHCRRRESMDAEEEVYLDENDLAEGHEFFHIGAMVISPSHSKCAYMADTDGSERYHLFVRDLASGETIDSSLEGIWDIVWGEEEDSVYYVVLDEVHRPYKVFKHVVGSDPEKDMQVYHEKDETFEYLRLSKSKSRRYIVITAQSLTKSEVWLVRSDGSDGPRLFRPRKNGVKYYVTHVRDRFFVLTNEDSANYKLMYVDEASSGPEGWKEAIPSRESTAMCISEPIPWIEPFDDFIAMIELEDGLFGIRILDLTSMTTRKVALPERFCALTPMFGADMSSPRFRISCSSLVTPGSVYECDLRTGELTLLKRDEVPGYDESRYDLSRIVARAEDGTPLPIFLVRRKGLERNGRNPLYLEGYGSYGDFEEAPTPFSPSRVSLLDRGFVCAFAQIRGGGEMGQGWYRQGVLLNKKTTFTDFIACAEHLIREGYTSKDRLVVRGRSAGGLLMGAVLTMRPDLFQAVVADVAFVDVISTQQDPSIPLVPGEWEEWGNPSIPEHYRYQKSYSPYDNIARREYPRALFTSGMNDPRVPYWEPVKMVAKLRELKTDDNLLLLVTSLHEGHRGGSGRYDSLREEAFTYAFMLDSVGISE